MSIYSESSDSRLIDLRNRMLNQSVKYTNYGSYLIDNRELLYSGDSMLLVATLLWEHIKPHKPEIIFGAGMGGSGLISAIQLIATQDGYKLDILLSRGSRKTYSGMKIIEGVYPDARKRAVFVDDLFNTGATYRKTIKECKVEGIDLEIVAVACLIDFWSGTGTRQLEVTGVPVVRLFRRHDLGLTRSEENVDYRFEMDWWKFDLNWDDGKNTIVKSVITFDGERGYVGSDQSQFICFDALNGNTLWSYDLQKKFIKGISNRALIIGDYVLFGAYDGIVHCLHKMTGEVLWKNQICGTIHSSPQYVEELDCIIIGTEEVWDKGYFDKDYYGSGDVVCIEVKTGKVLWQYYTQGMIPCTPAIDTVEKRIYSGSNDANLYCLDYKGNLIWKSATQGEVKGQPFIKEDFVIVASISMIEWFNKHTGERVRTIEVGKTYHIFFTELDNGWLAIPLFYGVVVAFDPLTGEIKWNCQTRGTLAYSVCKMPGDKLFVTNINKGQWLIIDATTGEKLSYKNDGEPNRQPAVFNADLDRLYVTTNKSGLMCYKVKSNVLPNNSRQPHEPDRVFQRRSDTDIELGRQDAVSDNVG